MNKMYLCLLPVTKQYRFHKAEYDGCSKDSDIDETQERKGCSLWRHLRRLGLKDFSKEFKETMILGSETLSFLRISVAKWL